MDIYKIWEILRKGCTSTKYVASFSNELLKIAVGIITFTVFLKYLGAKNLSDASTIDKTFIVATANTTLQLDCLSKQKLTKTTPSRIFKDRRHFYAGGKSCAQQITKD